MRHCRGARAMWIVAASVGLVTCARSCGDRGELVGDDRELGRLALGDASLIVTAQLRGHHRRVRVGGGRLTTSLATSEELWEVTAEVSGPTDRALLVDSDVRWRGDDGDRGRETLEGLGLERCGDRSTAVYRITGLEDQPWHVAHSGPRQLLVAQIDTVGDECAAVLAAAPTAAAVLRRLRDEGLSAAVERDGGLPRERASPVDGEETGRSPQRARLARHACAAMLRLGDARAAVRCVLALGILPTDPAVREIVDEIRRGEAARPDAELALFDAIAPGAAEAEGSPFEAAIERGFDRVAAKFLRATTTTARQRAFVEVQLERCDSAASEPCPGWRLEALGVLAARLDDRESCDRAHRLARRELDRPGGPRRALRALRELEGCGGEEVRRETLIASLDRPTLAEPRDCPEHRRDCGSLPRLAGRWLAAHCHPTAVARAEEVLPAALASREDSHPYRDGLVDGPFRVLRSCDPEALRRALARTGRTELEGWRN